MHCIHDKFCDLTFFIFLKVNMRNLNNVNFSDLGCIYLVLKNFFCIFCLNVGKLFVVLQSQTAAQRPRSGIKCGGSAKSFGNLTVSEASGHTYMNSVYPR